MLLEFIIKYKTFQSQERDKNQEKFDENKK